MTDIEERVKILEHLLNDKLGKIKRLENTVEYLHKRVGELNLEQGKLLAQTGNVSRVMDKVDTQMAAMSRSVESYQVVVNERIEILAEEMEITV